MNIAIKLPNDLNERVLTFPFLHTLHKVLSAKLEEEEALNIHLISLKNGIDVLNLLPFHAYYHELEEEDIKSIFTMHRACVNLKIESLDVFISTTDSFVDASIGKNYNAKERVGFALGKNAWFFNNKISKLLGQHFSNQVYELLKGVFDDVPPIPNVYSRNLDSQYSDWNENLYTLINLDVVGKEINPEWKDFLELFDKKTFVLMCSELDFDNGDDIEKFQTFMESLPSKNIYRTFEDKSNIAFGKIVSYCAGFVTGDSPLVNIAAYCGAQTFHLHSKGKLNQLGPNYFIADVRHFSITDPMFGNGSKFNYSKIFDELYAYIEQKTKVDESE
ncbi:MAG: ADP-heptose:LPS heptosyltransferase [Bacteriovoracaceae bacterium]|jgi:ADP-heptose:LPS heptosyltransferase